MPTSPDYPNDGRLASNFGWEKPVYLSQRQRGIPPTIPDHVREGLPVIEDFRILLSPHDDGYLALEFWSALQGFLVHGFPFRDFLREEFLGTQELTLGIGTTVDPLVDFEMGHELFVWRQQEEVLVIQGDFEAEPGSFRVAIRVPEAVFASEWWTMVRVLRRWVIPAATPDDGDDLVPV